MKKDFFDWLEYYKDMNEEQYNAISGDDKKQLIQNYNKDVEYGWRAVKHLLIESV